MNHTLYNTSHPMLLGPMLNLRDFHQVFSDRSDNKGDLAVITEGVDFLPQA